MSGSDASYLPPFAEPPSERSSDGPSEFAPPRREPRARADRTAPLAAASDASPAPSDAPGEQTGGLSRPRTSWLDELLQHTIRARASDLHIMAGEPPRIRVGGELSLIPGVRALVAGEIDTTLARIVPEASQRRFVEEREVDFAYVCEGYRFRVSAFLERRGTALAVRRLDDEIPSLDAIGVPKDLARSIYAPGGLVLIAGHAGAGKTTTMFALLQELCDRRTAHVISLEDPIEFRIQPRQAFLEQRELGRHFKSYREGVRDALRAAPDCMVFGELRETETIRLALQAAEAGLLVFATVHAYDVTRTVMRIVNAFPVDEQLEARVALAYTVRMIAAQTLLKRASGTGRIPAVEMCHAGSALSNLVREGKEHEIATLIEASRSRGMRTLDQALVELAQQGLVKAEEAIFRSVRKENVERMLGG